MNPTLSEFEEKCRSILDKEWNHVVKAEGHLKITLPEKIKEAVKRAINSDTKSYRYVLPTQLLAKLADSSLDSKCLQASRGGKGAFDARSVCHDVVVPFDQANECVLGGSPEPYVNNPLRRPEVTSKYRHQQKDKAGWDDLSFILQEVESKNDPVLTLALLQAVLAEIYQRLSQVKVTYSVPKRISLAQADNLIQNFIRYGAGGDRVLSLTTALLRTAGKLFSLYAEVRRLNINASDASSGLVADIECLDKNGEIALAVEVRDKQLTISQVQAKMPKVRSHSVSELLFIAQKGIAGEDISKIESLRDKEFASGQNIYIFSLTEFAPVLLTLFGEKGRREFLEEVGKVLDSHSTIKDRRDWAELLKSS
ncbi:restriction endonuclease, SacI family [bacterium]|nr:restriction endonuclease, SacI family [bacterium]